MADILQRILAVKAGEVAAAQAQMSLVQVQAAARAAAPARDFAGAMRSRITTGRSAVIAEVKKASPSKGVLRESFEPAAIAPSYQRHRAACPWVPPDHHFFRGAMGRAGRPEGGGRGGQAPGAAQGVHEGPVPGL